MITLIGENGHNSDNGVVGWTGKTTVQRTVPGRVKLNSDANIGQWDGKSGRAERREEVAEDSRRHMSISCSVCDETASDWWLTVLW